MKLKFEFSKETKGTLQFKELSETPVISTIYLKKSALKDLGYENGDSITVDVVVDKR